MAKGSGGVRTVTVQTTSVQGFKEKFTAAGFVDQSDTVQYATQTTANGTLEVLDDGSWNENKYKMTLYDNLGHVVVEETYKSDIEDADEAFEEAKKRAAEMAEKKLNRGETDGGFFKFV